MSPQTISTRGHLPGRPISATTYKSHGCRCDACRALYNQYQRSLTRKNGAAPSLKAQRKANNAAIASVRENHPDVWKRFYDEAYSIEAAS